jgi:hypothetical protein
MTTASNSLDDMQAVSLGTMMAIRDALAVLIRTHQDIGKVAEMMRNDREETVSIMLAKGYPDKSVDAYRDMIDMIRPHLDGGDMNPP